MQTLPLAFLLASLALAYLAAIVCREGAHCNNDAMQGLSFAIVFLALITMALAYNTIQWDRPAKPPSPQAARTLPN